MAVGWGQELSPLLTLQGSAAVGSCQLGCKAAPCQGSEVQGYANSLLATPWWVLWLDGVGVPSSQLGLHSCLGA